MTVLLGDEFAGVLAAAQAGEDWAVARLYRTLQPELLRYLSVREPQAAEDIAAQVWLELARSLPAFDGTEDHFRAFVYTVARRRMLNERRRRARRWTEPIDHSRLDDRACAPDDPADETVARVSGNAAVREIVSLLPPDHAEIVLLRVVADFSVQEVAEIVGRRESTVRVIQHRALKRLATLLADPVTPRTAPGM
jgi:RNA polymerase sigma-70 factor (ECF subfamily)